MAASVGAEDDAELAELLDSALADFNGSGTDKTSTIKSQKKKEERQQPQQKQQQSSKVDRSPTDKDFSSSSGISSCGNTAEAVASSDPNESAEQLASELLGGLQGLYHSVNEPVTEDKADEFISRLESQISNLDSTMRSLIEPTAGDDSDPGVTQMKEELRRLVDNIDKSDVDSSEDLQDISKTMQDTLRKLNEDLPDSQGPSEAAASSDSSDPLAPFMEQMLSALLSREVLYVPLKGIIEKYPTWIDENASSLPPEKASAYRKQLELMREVCREFEKSPSQEPNTMKIFDLVQKMQELGPPPDDLVGVGDEDLSLPPALAKGSPGSGCPTM